MGNYTSIEAEFNNRLAPQANSIMESQQNAANPQLVQNQIHDLIQKTLFEIRKEKMQALCGITDRNLICYISAWLQSAAPIQKLCFSNRFSFQHSKHSRGYSKWIPCNSTYKDMIGVINN